MSPGQNNTPGINCTIDADVESILNFAGSHPTHPGSTARIPPEQMQQQVQFPQPQAPPGADRLANIPQNPQTVPPGTMVQRIGNRVFFRDSSGHLTPAPDGFWVLPGGNVMHVVNGQAVDR